MINRHRRPSIRVRARRGTILIVTMLVVFALAAAVLAMSRSMRVEMMASANSAAAVQASAVERGAEQYVLGILAENGSDVMTMTEDNFAGIQVGDGYFWLLRPNYDDNTLPIYGLVDECSKLDLNISRSGATGMSEARAYNMLLNLPGMTEDIPPAIIDWIDADDDMSNQGTGGAESQYYLTLPEPYSPKNDRFESVEELLMVRGVTRQMLYGDGTIPTVAAMAQNVPV